MRREKGQRLILGNPLKGQKEEKTAKRLNSLQRGRRQAGERIVSIV